MKTLDVITAWGPHREAFEMPKYCSMVEAFIACRNRGIGLRWLVMVDAAAPAPTAAPFYACEWISTLNCKVRGQANLRNLALEMSTADYIAVSDSDDWYAPEYWANLIDAIPDSAPGMETGYARQLLDVPNGVGWLSDVPHGVHCGVWRRAALDRFTGWDGKDGARWRGKWLHVLNGPQRPVMFVHDTNHTKHTPPAGRAANIALPLGAIDFAKSVLEHLDASKRAV